MNEPRPATTTETKARERSVLGVVFLTVFLDMVGFSIIFPLFPAMLDWYLEREGSAGALGRLTATLESFAPNRFAVIALFGGFLGALYSALQFITAPLWGRASDRRGRRGVLLVTLCGTALSYVLWFFSGSFLLLVAARLLGGAMAGNISIASAAVADVLKGSERAKGMGVLGAGIGLGFVVGPALGGVTANLDLTQVLGGSEALGVNRFSGAAALAFALAVLNVVWAWRAFPETNPPERRAHTGGHEGRSLNPFGKLSELAFAGVRGLFLGHFVYLCAFGAMEFSLVFLATEHLGYSPLDNAGLFVFIGLTIALVQGGLVRRLVPKLGERVVAARGLMITLLGFLALGAVPLSALPFERGGRAVALWFGAGLVAIGTSLVMPSFSSLASRYVPDDRQGFALGVFRSLGSLARVVGPLAGGLAYYALGAWSPYLLGAAVLCAPIWLATRLPAPPAADGDSAPSPRAGSDR